MTISEQSAQLKKTVYASLFAALIAVGAFISIPIGPVPINLQTMFVLLAGLLLGRKWGAACVGIYLLAGAIGLPVFAGGTGGIAKLIGPTGGYLIGFLAAVYVIGLISEKTNNPDYKKSYKNIMEILAMLLGTIIIYITGVSWLMVVTGMSFKAALLAGCVPFLPGDILKLIAAFFLARSLRPLMNIINL